MSKKALVLRVNDKDGKSYGGFQWPLEVGATVTAPDWKKNEACGNGLHGWLYGQGDHSCTDRWAAEGALWYVVEVNLADVVMLGGKCKFPGCVVKFIGDKKSATDYLWEREPQSRNCAVIGAQRADLRDGVHVQVGVLGTATAGDRGTATAGDRGTATAGYRGTATAGYSGTATAGDSGTATAGDSGTATAGDRGTATAGKYGCICILFYDAKVEAFRKRCAEVDGVIIKADTPYRLDDSGNFVEVIA